MKCYSIVFSRKDKANIRLTGEYGTVLEALRAAEKKARKIDPSCESLSICRNRDKEQNDNAH